MDERQKLEQAIEAQESLRGKLDDAIIDAAIAAIKQQQTSLDPPFHQQRKLATILFADIVGSTKLIQGMDPEEQMALIDPIVQRMAAKVSEHGGHVCRYQGDGFKAVFGLPVAHENDPTQAIRAGLAIQAEAALIAEELQSERGITGFQVRVGISTGLVFCGGETEGEETIKGEPVNLASRLESAAAPGTVLISHHTYRHVRGVFNVDLQKPITAKGFPEPIQVYLVKEIKPRAFRLQTKGVEGVETHMVGRQSELKFLQDTLMTAFEEGVGHLVTVSGEAGVGKSRLLYEFQNWLDLLPGTRSVRFFLGRGRQESSGSPFSLLRDLFSFRFQILDHDKGEQARAKIEAGFGMIFGTESDGVMRAHIVGPLLGFDFSKSPHLKGVIDDAEQLRNRGLLYLIQYFKALSKEMPVVIFLEDIHWADDSSIDVVNRIGEITQEHPIILICATRLRLFERRPYWGEGQTYHTRIELRLLSKQESRQLVAEILKLVDDIPAELRDLVVNGAEGNPFYMEELIKMLIEDGVIVPDEETWQVDLSLLEIGDVPATLTGVLQARLDSLPTSERTVLQQASVVGRLFWDRIIAYIQTEGEGWDNPQQIPQALTSLRNRELVYRHEESAFEGAGEYFFKHDLMREVTYESVSRRLRKTYHGLVADWLIANSGDRIGEYNGVIADHLLIAEKKVQACEYFTKAGKLALSSFASVEAERYFEKALKICSEPSQQADLTFAYARSLHWQGQSRYEESQQYYRQAIDLYEQFGDHERMAEIYKYLSWLLWDIDYLQAWEMCQEALDKLKDAPDSVAYARLLAEAGRTAHYRKVTDQVISLSSQAQEMAAKFEDLEASSEAGITLALYLVDPSDCIRQLKDIIEVTEAEGLLRIASRAHVALGFFYNVLYIDCEAAFYHRYRAAELAKQFGDVQRILWAFVDVIEFYFSLGKLKDVENLISDFFMDSNVSQEAIEHVVEYAHCQLHDRMGYWETYLDLYRPEVDRYRQGGSFQEIAWGNYFLANSQLELNRFDSLGDLSEAEERLKENIDIGWLRYISYLMLVIVYARIDQFGKAKDILLEAEEHAYTIEDNGMVQARSSAEFELAFAEKRWNDAVKFSEKTIAIMESSKHHWKLARKLIDLGDALIGRNDSGDCERAQEIYQQSLEMFTEMGAPGYIKVVEDRLRI